MLEDFRNHLNAYANSFFYCMRTGEVSSVMNLTRDRGRTMSESVLIDECYSYPLCLLKIAQLNGFFTAGQDVDCHISL